MPMNTAKVAKNTHKKTVITNKISIALIKPPGAAYAALLIKRSCKQSIFAISSVLIESM